MAPVATLRPRPRPANLLRELRRERKELTMARNKAATVPTPNDATHTPGPWEATNTGWGHSVIHPPDCPRDSDDYVIAYVPRGGVLNTADVGRANARLIKAAPDMLHALKQAEIVFMANNIDCAGVRTVQAAITKATKPTTPTEAHP
jgi:hypothetical protein